MRHPRYSNYDPDSVMATTNVSSSKAFNVKMLWMEKKKTSPTTTYQTCITGSHCIQFRSINGGHQWDTIKPSCIYSPPIEILSKLIIEVNDPKQVRLGVVISVLIVLDKPPGGIYTSVVATRWRYWIHSNQRLCLPCCCLTNYVHSWMRLSTYSIHSIILVL